VQLSPARNYFGNSIDVSVTMLLTQRDSDRKWVGWMSSSAPKFRLVDTVSIHSLGAHGWMQLVPFIVSRGDVKSSRRHDEHDPEFKLCKRLANTCPDAPLEGPPRALLWVKRIPRTSEPALGYKFLGLRKDIWAMVHQETERPDLTAFSWVLSPLFFRKNEIPAALAHASCRRECGGPLR
jgi:hypothetical protein